MLLGASIGMATYNSPFQSLLVNQYLKSLSRKLETTITVESVSISIFNNVTINKIYIEDLDKDTLLYADKINVDVKVFSLNDQKIILDEVKLDNAFFNLKASEKETNLAFIIDYFASNDTTDSDWEFAVNEVVLNQSRFDFNNETVAPIPKGLDFNHLSLTDINADISDIELFIGVECKINHLSLKDKSGFILNDFIADTKVSDQGIFTEGLVINTPNSHIEGLIGFGTEKYADLADFFEAVKINALFQETKLDFNDLFVII